MAGVIAIKNWSKHQHYKKRSPPWVKVYRELLDPTKCTWYRKLSDSSSRFLYELWLEASHYDGKIPYDSLMILKSVGRPASDKPLLDKALEELHAYGAITVSGDDASADFFASLAPMLAPMQADPLAYRGERGEGRGSVGTSYQPGLAPRVIRTRVHRGGDDA